MSEYIIELPNGGAADECIRLRGYEKNLYGYELHEEIVRCRDCKHFTPKGAHKFENGKVNADYCTYVRSWMLQITPDGYCKWGERRSE